MTFGLYQNKEALFERSHLDLEGRGDLWRGCTGAGREPNRKNESAKSLHREIKQDFQTVT